LVLIAILLTVLDRPGWGFLFTYSAACTAVIAAPRYSFPAVATLTALAAACCAIGGGGAGVPSGTGPARSGSACSCC
jgi:hypothetical protein